MTNVQFYIETEEFTTPLAVFPDISEGDDKVCCYTHIGQHSTASLHYVNKLKISTPTQFHNLLNELINQGYNDLFVMNGPKNIIPISVARGYAANWHDGQDSPLYSFASTGRILPGLIADYIKEVFECLKSSDKANHTGFNSHKELTALYYFFLRYQGVINRRRAALNTIIPGKADNKELCLALENEGENLRIWIGREHAISNPDNTLCIYMRLDVFQQTSATVCNGNSHLSESPTYKAICKHFEGFAPRLTDERLNDILELTLSLKERDVKPW